MHSMRIPFPLDERDMSYVEDFRVLHLGAAPLNRVRAKERFYMFVDWQKTLHSPLKIARFYLGCNTYPKELLDLPQKWIYTQAKDGWDMWSNVELDETHCWMDDYIYERLDKYPMRELIKLPIWTPEFLEHYHLKDPRPFKWRLIHRYLQATQARNNTFLIRAIDKILSLCA